MAAARAPFDAGLECESKCKCKRRCRRRAAGKAAIPHLMSSANMPGSDMIYTCSTPTRPLLDRPAHLFTSSPLQPQRGHRSSGRKASVDSLRVQARPVAYSSMSLQPQRATGRRYWTGRSAASVVRRKILHLASARRAAREPRAVATIGPMRPWLRVLSASSKENHVRASRRRGPRVERQDSPMPHHLQRLPRNG